MRRADRSGDCIVRCTARVELAGSLIYGSGTGEALVDRMEVERLWDGFRAGCRGLKDWYMDQYAHGENSSENITREFIAQTKPSAKEVKRAYARRGQEIVQMRVPTWTRPGFVDNGSALKLSTCDGCGKHFDVVKKCVGCKSVSYCGKTCQLAHWPEHKKRCKEIRAAAAAGGGGS